ncbi:unnamed protein product, partial [Ectocarpus fasciculatus]
DGGVAGTNALTIVGDASFAGTVGTTALSGLSVNGTALLGGNVSTTGTQTYTGLATLSGGNRTLSGSLVDLNGGVQGGANALFISGNLDMGAGAVALTTLNVSGTSILAGDVTSSGAQTYGDGAGDNVTLNGSVTLDSTSGGLISFTAAVDGTATSTNNLTIDGDAEFDGVVGGISALGTLDVSGELNVDDGSIVNAGALTAGSALINGDIGTGGSVAGLQVNGATTLGASVDTTGSQTY